MVNAVKFFRLRLRNFLFGRSPALVYLHLAHFITIPANSWTPLRAAAATPLPFWVTLKWMAKGEEGQNCCYCSTKACGHKEFYHLGEQRARLLISWGYHNTVQWSLIDSMHQRVCVHICMPLCLCLPERETGRQGELDGTMKSHRGNHNFGIIGKMLWKMLGGEWWGKQCGRRSSESRKAVGCWLLFYPLRGSPIMNGGNSRMGSLIGSSQNLFVV